MVPSLQVKVVNTKKGSGHVVLMSGEEVRSFPLFRCDKASTCTQCVALQVQPHLVYFSAFFSPTCDADEEQRIYNIASAVP